MIEFHEGSKGEGHLETGLTAESWLDRWVAPLVGRGA